MKQCVNAQQPRAFRSLAVRCLYLSLDRPDIESPARAICRYMSRPAVAPWRKLQLVPRHIRIHLAGRADGQRRVRRLELGRMHNYKEKHIGRGSEDWGSQCAALEQDAEPFRQVIGRGGVMPRSGPLARHLGPKHDCDILNRAWQHGCTSAHRQLETS